MTRTLYDLALADETVRPSPYCWIAKFALLHKGLPFETKAVTFADKANYPDPDYGKVPVLVDNGEMVKDSPVITQWLDKKYPQNPLVASKAERAGADYLAASLPLTLYPALAPFLIMRILNAVTEADKQYFRETREQRYGKTLEDVAVSASAERVEAALAAYVAPLASHRYFGGAAPNLSDYIAFAPLMWHRSLTVTDFCRVPEPVAQWRERMLDLFDGYARSAKSADAV